MMFKELIVSDLPFKIKAKGLQRKNSEGHLSEKKGKAGRLSPAAELY